MIKWKGELIMTAEKTYQVQLVAVDNDGNETPMCPISDVRDVVVGALSSGALVLPGTDPNETLITTLSNVRKYLSNMQNVAQSLREVSQDTRDASKINIPSTAVTAELQVDIDDINDEIDRINAKIVTVAPEMHADPTLKYGGATGEAYGHVKLSDVFATAEPNAAAANSVGASQSALYNAWNDLNTKKAPNNHAVGSNTYGLGSASLYGHVKTSNEYQSTSTDAAEVATRKALYDAWFAIKTTNDNQQTAIDGKAPIGHASSETKYGLGTTGNYGHLKVNDGYNSDNSSSGAAANGVAASSWAVYRAYSSLSTVVNTKLAATHADVVANGTTFGHVKVTDKYDASQGAASAGVVPSSLALYNSYAALSSSISTAQNDISTLNNNINQMKQDFQAGVDSIYNALVAAGATPGSKDPADIVSAIEKSGSSMKGIILPRLNSNTINAGSSTSPNFCTINTKGASKLKFKVYGYANHGDGKAGIHVYGSNTFDSSKSYGGYGNPCTDGVNIATVVAWAPSGGTGNIDVSGYDYVYFTAYNNNSAYAGLELRGVELL